ncbi:MAG: hypothetical protein ACK45F_06425, partial [bacterium]
FVVALWIGAYLTTARGKERAARWAAASLFCLALYFLHAVLCLHVPAVHAGFLWRRFLGWFVLPFLALWVHATVDATTAGPTGRWGRLLLSLSSGAAAGLSGLWLLGSWTFASTLLQPVELRVPVAVYGLVASALAAGAWVSSPDSPRGLARALALVSCAWGLGTAVLPALRLPGLSAAVPVLTGHGLALAGLLGYGTLVARTGLFVAGAAIPRDFLHNLAASAFLLLLYGGSLVVSARVASHLRFDPVALSAVVVLGLVIVTHLLVDDVRAAWDRLFFPSVATLRKHLRSLSSQLARDDRVAVVDRVVADLKGSLGARWASLLLSEGTGLGFPDRVGDLPEASGNEGPDVLRHPVYVGDRLVGYLAVAPRTDGPPFGEQERFWLSLVAGHISLLLCHETVARAEVEKLEATLRRLREIQEEQARIQLSVRRLAAGGVLRPGEVRRMLRAGASPARLHDLVFACPALAFLRHLPPDKAGFVLRKALEAALEAIRPEGDAPSVQELRDRPLRAKRKMRLPAAWAEYHIGRLLLAGYSAEAIADRLDLSARQVHSYVERLAVRLAPLLELKLREFAR